MNAPLILVVDDDKAIRFLLEGILSERFRVVSFGDVVQANAWLDEGHIPQLIICDINMPYINGIEFMLSIRSSGIYEHIPVIMLSAYNRHEAEQKCLQLGASAYFEKPFDPHELLQTIEEVFRQTDRNT